MEEEKLRAVYYARCSTEEENQKDALVRQAAEAEEAIRARGWRLVDAYVESRSGTSRKGRWEYNRLYEDLEQNRFDVVVIKSQDRLMRNTRDWYLFADRLNCAGKRLYFYELATLSRHNIPIIEVVVNNHVLGMVRQWQTLFYGKRYSNTVLQDQADFVKVAEALGVKGIRVTKKEEMGPAIREAIEGGKPALIDVWIDCDEKVFPMVPAGAPIEDVFDAEDLAKKEQEKD